MNRNKTKDKTKLASYFSIARNKNKFPIVLWLILITSGLLFLSANISLSYVILSVVFTSIVCVLMFVDTSTELNKKIRVVYDLLELILILLLILIFGFWGLAYSIFFLSILFFGAFKYSTKEFIFLFLIVLVSLVIIWFVQDLTVYRTSFVKNVFFAIAANCVFAVAILSRMLALESLSMAKREKNLSESQAALLIENESIRAILDNMENAVIVVDGNNKITFANNNIFDIFEVFKNKKISSISIDELIMVDSSGRNLSLKDIIKSSEDKSYSSGLSVVVNDKTKNVNLSVSKSYNSKETYRGSIISLHSLTSNEVLEKSKIEFSSLASHEIRTPLTAMDGYIYLMLNSNKFEYNDLTKEYLSLLHDTTNDLIKLANSILQMSKIDDGTIRVDIEKNNLGELIKEISENESKSAKAKGLSIECVIEKIPAIITDKVKVKEIVTNLVENAIKFSNSGVIKISIDQTGQEITISVEDSGIGIPDAAKGKIFDKFYQVESYDTRKNSGSGLGLYLSKSLAKRIGGDLILENAQGNGSKFSLILPIKYPFDSDISIVKDKKLKEFIEGF